MLVMIYLALGMLKRKRKRTLTQGERSVGHEDPAATPTPGAGAKARRIATVFGYRRPSGAEPAVAVAGTASRPSYSASERRGRAARRHAIA